MAAATCPRIEHWKSPATSWLLARQAGIAQFSVIGHFRLEFTMQSDQRSGDRSEHSRDVIGRPGRRHICFHYSPCCDILRAGPLRRSLSELLEPSVSVSGSPDQTCQQMNNPSADRAVLCETVLELFLSNSAIGVSISNSPQGKFINVSEQVLIRPRSIANCSGVCPSSRIPAGIPAITAAAYRVIPFCTVCRQDIENQICIGCSMSSSTRRHDIDPSLSGNVHY